MPDQSDPTVIPIFIDPDHCWPIVSLVILPQANINKGFDMILNSGDLKSPSAFWALILTEIFQ